MDMSFFSHLILLTIYLLVFYVKYYNLFYDN